MCRFCAANGAVDDTGTGFARPSGDMTREVEMEKRSVLFVDDETNILNALRRTLRREPYEVFTANGPSEAFDIMREHEIDLIVSDHLMPSMDGLTFLKKVREQYPQMVRVLLTGHADLQLAIEAINEGEVFRFLTKPWTDVDLKMTLKHIFDYIGLRRENQMLLHKLQQQQRALEKIEAEHPGILKVERDERGFIVIEEDNM